MVPRISSESKGGWGGLWKLSSSLPPSPVWA